MDKRYPNNADPRPKRRRDKYNPYTIYSVGAETDVPHFYVTFTDTTGDKVSTEISKDIFELLNQFELEDISHLNKIDRHYVYLTENELGTYIKNSCTYISPETLLEYEDLYAAINKLPQKQRKRLLLYYFEGLNLEEIAKIENSSIQSVSKTIISAKRKLKKML